MDLGRQLFTRIKSELAPVSKVERDAKMEGKRMILVLQPDHKTDKAPPPPAQATSPSRPAVSGTSMNIRPPAAAPAPVVAAAAAAPAPAVPAAAAAPQPAGTTR